MRVLKVLVLLVVVASFSLIGAGYTLDERFEHRATRVVDAAPAQVWALVSDPRGAARWMPPEMSGGGIIEVREVDAPTGSAATAPAAVAAAGDAAPLLGRRFILRQRDQSTITVEVVERIQGKRAIDRVVANSIGFEGYYPELAWGFEMAPTDGGKTALTATWLGRAGRPWGTIQNKLVDMTGGTGQMLLALVKSVEVAAKAPAPEAAGPIGAPLAPPGAAAGTGTGTPGAGDAERKP